MYIICIHNSPQLKSILKYSNKPSNSDTLFSDPYSQFLQNLRCDTSRNVFPSDFSSDNLYRVPISSLLALLISLSFILSAQCVMKLTSFEVPLQPFSRVTSFLTRQHVPPTLKDKPLQLAFIFSLPQYSKFYSRIEKTKKPIVSQACGQQLEEYSVLVKCRRMSVMQKSDEYKYREKRTVNQAMLHLYLTGRY